MFMKVIKEITENDVHKGFQVVLFDNRKGGKDHNVKLATDLRRVFARIQRNGWVTTSTGYPEGVNDDVEFARFHDVRPETKGYKIENVKFEIENGSDGRVGVVSALITPFGPQFNTLREAITKRDEMNFSLCHLFDKTKAIYKVLSVGYKTRKPALAL